MPVIVGLNSLRGLDGVAAMNHISTDQELAMKGGFLNITLALVAIGVWATIALGDILPGSPMSSCSMPLSS